MRLVYFNLGVTHLLVLHDDVEQFLGQAFKQRKAIVFDMPNHRLGDGAIIQRLLDLIDADRIGGRIEDGGVDEDILLIEDFLFL